MSPSAPGERLSVEASTAAPRIDSRRRISYVGVDQSHVLLCGLMYVGSEVVGRSTVLVVDDEPTIRYLLAATLEPAGYEVIEAPHGEAALEAARRAPPELVITDRMMPVMGGTELINQLRADVEMAQIPIILLTATSVGTPLADAVLTKPFEPDKLIELVDTLIGRKGH